MTEQERAEWEHPWPQDSEQCPECEQGLLYVREFGKGRGLEVHAWCVGLNGNPRPEDEDEAEEGDGCGWAGLYHPPHGKNKYMTNTSEQLLGMAEVDRLYVHLSAEEGIKRISGIRKAFKELAGKRKAAVVAQLREKRTFWKRRPRYPETMSDADVWNVYCSRADPFWAAIHASPDSEYNDAYRHSLHWGGHSMRALEKLSTMANMTKSATVWVSAEAAAIMHSNNLLPR